MNRDQAIRSDIRQFIVENYLFGRTGEFPEEESFLESGILDSTGVLELVAFLEEKFGIQVDDQDMTTENLDSISKIAIFVQAKRSAQMAQRGLIGAA